jgi:hypothetical protein
MFAKKQTNQTQPSPQSSADWRCEFSRLEAELAQAREKIEAESGRRAQLAIAAADGDAEADREFNKSFTIETQLQREGERLVALVSHAQRQIVAAEAAEKDVAERARLAALNAAWASQRATAARIDGLLAQLGAEAKEFENGYATIRNLRGSAPRRTSSTFELAAKHFGLRDIFGLHVIGPGRSLSDQVANTGAAAGQSSEAA